MKIILIGNYPLDKQESMNRFAEMLADGFHSKGIETEIWKPVVFFAKPFQITTSGIGKWLGYIDKWILFPLILKWRLTKSKFKSSKVKFHVCDHSNSPYLPYLPKDKTVITCHDVLAIRGAMGYKDAYCPASRTGKILQQWILNNLVKAKKLVSVSHFSLNQLKELAAPISLENKKWIVIHNAFNADFEPISEEESQKLLSEVNMPIDKPYILHVGSALPRKNRDLLLKMVVELGDKWEGYICFAGKAINESLMQEIKRLGLTARVKSIVRPSHKQLVALYSACEAFIFPSLSEGFGWPLIEAQACGTPVIASNLEPMPEVSGNTAIHVNPHDAKGFAKALLSLNTTDKRNEIINSGFENIKRFHISKVIDAYVTIHKDETN